MMTRELIATFDAGGLTAFTNRTGHQIVSREFDQFFISGLKNGVHVNDRVSEERVIHIIIDNHPYMQLRLSSAGQAMLDKIHAAEARFLASLAEAEE